MRCVDRHVNCTCMRVHVLCLSLLAGVPTEGKVIVVNPDTDCELPDGHIGELWIASNSMTGGYWNNPTATSATFCCKLNHFVHH